MPGVDPGMPPSAPAGAGAPGGTPPGEDVIETKVNTERENIGRNDPCWCGSGKKYKKCHGA